MKTKILIISITIIFTIFSCNNTTEKIETIYASLEKLKSFDERINNTEIRQRLNSFLEHNKESSEGHYLRANLFYELKNYDSTLLDLREVLKVYPNDLQSLYLTANVLYKQKKTKESYDLLEKCLSIIDQQHNLYFHHYWYVKLSDSNILALMGYSKRNDKEYESALQIFDSLIEKYPNEAMNYNDRAFTFLLLKDTSNACTDYLKFKRFNHSFKNIELEKICLKY